MAQEPDTMTNTNPIGEHIKAATGTNCLSRYAARNEAKAARALVRAILAQGYAVSVHDGEETTVKRSTSERKIFDAMCTTGEDSIIAHRPDLNNASGWHRAGTFFLVYGNAEDGSELIADHTDNDYCNALVAALPGGEG
jgi:hypothetical protein